MSDLSAATNVFAFSLATAFSVGFVAVVVEGIKPGNAISKKLAWSVVGCMAVMIFACVLTVAGF